MSTNTWPIPRDLAAVVVAGAAQTAAAAAAAANLRDCTRVQVWPQTKMAGAAIGTSQCTHVPIRRF